MTPPPGRPRAAWRLGRVLPARRGARDVTLALSLVVLWVLLWGNLSVANVLSGLAVAFLVMHVFPLPPLATRPKVHPLRVAWFLACFLADLVRATLEVVWQVLRVGRQPRNAVVAVTLRTGSELTLSLTAIAVSLIPGSLVVEVRRSTHTLFIHVLGAGDAATVERAKRDVLALEARLIRAIGGDDERRLLRTAPTEEAT